MSRYQDFMAAKQAVRAHPDWTDEQVAEHLGLNIVVNPAALNDIREARKDVAAGDTTQPDTRPV